MKLNGARKHPGSSQHRRGKVRRSEANFPTVDI